MGKEGARAKVRRRLLASLPGAAVFVALGLIGGAEDSQPWLFVGIGMALSATFLEPYFSTPRAATVNSVGGIAACVSADVGEIQSLWTGLIVFLGIVFLAGAVAALTPDGRLNSACGQFARRFGHAVIVGGSVLLLIVLTEAQQANQGFELLAVGSAALVIAISFDWVDLWSRVISNARMATAISAIGPRMLLLSGSPSPLREGDGVILEAAGERQVEATVAARLPHADGVRFRLALAEDWTTICDGFPQELTVQNLPSDRGLVGAVGEGTTQRTLQFEPFDRLGVGDPVLLRPPGKELLYQVARLRLVDSMWLGSTAVRPSATAHLVGSPEAGHIRSTTYLPGAHDPIHQADDLAGALGTEYFEIGQIKGTAIPIGLRADDQRRGHIAILGMSGMGKTAVSQRICAALGLDHVVVALDTTGEYLSRLSFPSWTTDDFDTKGHFVHQPAGDPPAKARQLIESFMKAGSDEYLANTEPARRMITLEEAHTFLPEWNFGLQSHKEQVANSTRMIMQARKFGLTFMLISQRTAVVSKSALSQCENYIILKTLDHTGLEYLESLVGSEMRDAIPALGRFEAMCVGPAFNAEEPVIISLTPPPQQAPAANPED
ncbi:MAG TPA: DUF87 domain-containing protein [Solirubrobacterales bacterium]|nr:DUF87 domain-containing protein [Solirubrobacterales bacterium]